MTRRTGFVCLTGVLPLNFSTAIWILVTTERDLIGLSVCFSFLVSAFGTSYSLCSFEHLSSIQEIVGYEELWYGNRGAATIKLSKNGNNVGPGTLQGTLTAQQGDNPGLKFPFQKMVSLQLQLL